MPEKHEPLSKVRGIMIFNTTKEKREKVLKGAIKNIRYHTFGRCTICGKFTPFICIDIMAANNNMYCIFCKSSSRKRLVAKLLIETSLSGISSIAEMPRANQTLRVLNTSLNDSFYQVLHNFENFYCSDLLPDIPNGTEIKKRVFCQNLEEMTFEDNSFDIVITEDVLEHVKDHIKAFKEIHRVLKTGGYHIFTVPFIFDRPTLVRVDTDKNVFLLPPEYHGDYLRGEILAYRTYGIDIYSMLDDLGFMTYIHLAKYRDQKWGIFESHAFVSRKVS
jgi:SAM-dependent methyltransferase